MKSISIKIIVAATLAATLFGCDVNVKLFTQTVTRFIRAADNPDGQTIRPADFETSPGSYFCRTDTLDLPDVTQNSLFDELVNVNSLILREVSFIATDKDFSFVRSINFSYIPPGTIDTPEEWVLVGQAQSDTGFGEEIPIELLFDLDFVQIVEDYGAENLSDFKLTFFWEGFVPSETVSWDIKLVSEIDFAVAPGLSAKQLAEIDAAILANQPQE